LTDWGVADLPLDQLALLALEHVDETDEWNSHNFLQAAKSQGRDGPALRALSEAMNWLIGRGMIARDTPGQSSAQSIFVTRLGKRVLIEGMGPTIAGERLAVETHPRLAKARSEFFSGDYEIAALAAMREVEIRVRELCGADASLIGVKLMREAFKADGGRLSDSTLDPGERVAMMELFAGAIGAFKNPPSHRQVDYADPTEASEVILLADLLMRLLDRQAESSSSTDA
jgi:uncharacterized protein (TIGR02391 family)